MELPELALVESIGALSACSEKYDGLILLTAGNFGALYGLTGKDEIESKCVSQESILKTVHLPFIGPLIASAAMKDKSFGRQVSVLYADDTTSKAFGGRYIVSPLGSLTDDTDDVRRYAGECSTCVIAFVCVWQTTDEFVYRNRRRICRNLQST